MTDISSSAATLAMADALAAPVEVYAFPLSYAQRRLWIIQKMEPQSAAYNIPFYRRLAGNLNFKALERSLNEIVRRHEILRTIFPEKDGEPIQEVYPHAPLGLPLIDLSELSEWERSEVARYLRHQEGEKPFDLEQGPLFRLKLLRLTAQEYELHFPIHHIVTDGWSEAVLMRELVACYSAFSSGGSSPLPELKIQYADYALWQRDWLQGHVLEKQLGYWRKQLADLPVLELPRDFPPREHPSHRGDTVHFRFEDRFSRKCDELVRSEGVTLFMVLLAGWQALLARYTGQKDVAVGTVIANRRQTETEDLIGFFANTLVLRTDLSGRLTFRELLRRVRQVTLEAYAHQDVPFDMLVKELNPARYAGGMPFVQSCLTLQNTPHAEAAPGGLQLSGVDLEFKYSIFDLLVTINNGPEGCMGIFLYSTDLFARRAMEQLARHFTVLLEKATANPDLPLELVSFLSQQERIQLLEEWNRTAELYTQKCCLHELFEQQVARTPYGIALIAGDRKYTYQELNSRANRVAHYLIAKGIGPESLVGIALDRSSDMVVAILGVLKAGAAYVPLDPEYPRTRLECMLEDSQVLLTDSVLLQHLPPLAGTVVKLDSQGAEIAAMSSLNPAVSKSPANLAYVIYTSGSTGKPKGVAICHSSAVTLLHWCWETFLPEELSHVLASTSICFDMSVFEIFAPLTCGGSMVMVGNALELAEMTKAVDVTLVDTVPSAVRELVKMKGIPESVRVINLGGEALSGALVREIYETTKVEKVFNLYGPSEDTTFSTFALVPRAHQGAAAPIGKPISNSRVYVLDEWMQVVPVGVVGQLYIGGVGLARGYLNRPGLTAESFIPDPFGGSAGGRMYRTGDLFRWSADGSLEFLGRADHQVKIRGFRIELGEIEAALQQRAEVEHAVVLALEDGSGEKRLTAYVVARGRQQEESAKTLREYLKGKLPEYMVPSAFVLLDHLPLTTNGKLDRKALPAPERGRESGHLPPRTPLEAELCRIWADVLKLDSVGIDDNFFELGGDSILSIRIVARAKEVGLGFLPSQLLEQQTISRLAETIAKAPSMAQSMEGVAAQDTDASAGLLPPPIQRRAPGTVVPLSYSQQRLWFLCQLDSGNQAYSLPAVLRLRGDLQVDTLSRALDEIVRRHEVLRTGFREIDGEPVQVISPNNNVGVEQIDLSGLPLDQREDRMRELVAIQIQLPFDLTSGQLFRSSLYKMGSDEHILCLLMHHIASDGWSISVFLRELIVLYDAFLHRRPSPLPELPLQYADVAVWEHQWLQGEVLDRHLNYWRTRLQDCREVLELSTDFPRPAVQSFRGGVQKLRLPAELASKLKQLSYRAGATEFMALLTVIDIWLSYHSGQNDILVGVPVSNRSHTETEALIGFFINTLLFRTRIDIEASFVDLLEQVRVDSLEAYAHQALPFNKLVDELRVKRDPGRNPLFQVMFNMETGQEQELAIPGLEVESVDSGLVQSRFDLHLYAHPAEDTLELVCIYSADLFLPSTIETMLGTLSEAIRLATAIPQQTVSALFRQLSDFQQRAVIERKRGRRDAQFKALQTVRRRPTSTKNK
jgi:amino acid adenylation domain-containing protein